MYDTLYEGVTVVDGTGAPSYVANVAVLGDVIALIGREKVRASRVVRGKGLTLCPGFIDMHAHSEVKTFTDPAMGMKTGQGITTEVCGNCGVGVYPSYPEDSSAARLAADVLGKGPRRVWDSPGRYLDELGKTGHGTNICLLQAHAPLRAAVMGSDSDRPAGDDEIAGMAELLGKSIEEGCYGFSTGLYYPPCSHADEKELLGLLEVVANKDALFSVHVRSEGDLLTESIREVVSLASRAGCRLEVSHLKAIGRANQDKLAEALVILREARDRGLEVGFDQYPYDYGSTSLFSLLPPEALALDRRELRFALSLDHMREEWRRSMEEGKGWESVWKLVGPGDIRVASLDSRPDLAGKTLSEIGEEAGKHPIEALFDILADETGSAVMTDLTTTRGNLEMAFADDLMCFGTDALYSSPSPHPRSRSAAVELISGFCLKRRIASIEETIRKMTGETARRLRLKGRGIIKEGCAADLVLLDLQNLSAGPGGNTGIVEVLVNGKEPWQLPGRALSYRK